MINRRRLVFYFNQKPKMLAFDFVLKLSLAISLTMSVIKLSQRKRGINPATFDNTFASSKEGAMVE